MVCLDDYVNNIIDNYDEEPHIKRNTILPVNLVQNTWTNWNISLIDDIGRIYTDETRWMHLESSNDIAKGDMFMCKRNSLMRFVVLNVCRERGHLVRAISIMPDESTSVDLHSRTLLQFVQEPLPVKAPQQLAPISKQIIKPQTASRKVPNKSIRVQNKRPPTFFL